MKPSRGTVAASCRFEAFSFGSIRIDGVTYEHDVLIDRGQVRKRKKKAQEIPGGFRPHAGIDGGSNPVEMPTASHRYRNGSPAGHGRSEEGGQAPPRPVAEAIEELGKNPKDTNAILPRNLLGPSRRKAHEQKKSFIARRSAGHEGERHPRGSDEQYAGPRGRTEVWAARGTGWRASLGSKLRVLSSRYSPARGCGCRQREGEL
jgi:hypothetical protein